MKKIPAKCYGEWTPHRYYRTESGHTFSINNTPAEQVVFYHGNVLVKNNPQPMKMLNDIEKAELFSRVEFID